MAVVEALTEQLAPGIPVIEVYNKSDLANPTDIPHGPRQAAISAKTGLGLDGLLRLIEDNLDTGVRRVKLLLPYAAAGEVSRIHREGKVFSEEYDNDGIRVEAALNRELQGRYRAYLQQE